MANFGEEKNLLKKENKEDGVTENKTLHWFACVGDNFTEEEKENTSTVIRDREEKLRIVREKQNEERQKKLEELKAQALAAQKFREQKEEERKRRIDDLKLKENDRRQQVEERKKLIWEAEKERREYILKKNQEREARIDCKRKNERSSIGFAFGSSTPRLLNTSETTNIAPSAFWNHRRATSITNVAFTGAQLTRRSSERDLSDVPKKRATSASGLDRKNEDQRHMSTSMYEVFNWSSSKDERPNKRYPLTIGPQIDIDDPNCGNSNNYGRGNETDSSSAGYRCVVRRKTDLMPTVPSPRSDRSFYGSRSSLGSLTPRTPGRTVSMTRLDQLSQPRRQNGEHISAIIERDRKRALDIEMSTAQSPNTKIMSQSMTNLHGININNQNSKNKLNKLLMHKTLSKSNASKSMIHLATKAGEKTTNKLKLRSDHIFQRPKEVLPPSNDLNKTGLRSGEATPGGSIATTSRPGSSMSNSVCVGVIQRRTPRKPRPVSIAGTGVTVLNGDLTDPKLKQERPPLPSRASLSKSSSVSRSPARSVENIKIAEKKTPSNKSSRPSSRTSTVAQAPVAKPRQVPQPPSTNVETINIDTEAENITGSVNLIEVENTSINNTEEVIEQIQQQVENITLEDNINVAHPVLIDNLVQDIPQALPVGETPPVAPIAQIPVKPVEETLVPEIQKAPEPVVAPIEIQQQIEESKPNLELNPLENSDMSASFMSKSRITTEEEAKAALAERRRLAREEAERQAELERLRIEEEERQIIQKQLEEEEQQRRLEEEAHRLAQIQRKAEDERLAQAIEEAKKRDEEERLRREEEARSKIEREETERKAREEAEKQRIETAERLKKEEKEREERRKRVEAIMARTRAKTGGAKGNDGQNNDSETSTTKPINNENNIIASTDNSNTTIDQSNNIELNIQNKDRTIEYENSVTEKENTLLGSFTQTTNNQTIKTDNVNNAVVVDKFQTSHENGKLTNLNNSDIIIENQNGHQDFSITNIKGIKETSTDGKTDLITEQLIDFNSAPHSIEDFNNKSNNNNNTSLVTSDSQENRDLSFV